MTKLYDPGSLSGISYESTCMLSVYILDLTFVFIYIDNLYFKSVIILHSKHELPGLLADYKKAIRV